MAHTFTRRRPYLTRHAPQERLSAAAAHYELLKGRNLSELERLGLQRAEDFRAALRHFGRVQAQMAAAVGEVWQAAGAAGAAGEE